MINLTDRVQMLCDDTELNCRINAAIARLKPLLYAKYGVDNESGRFALSAPDKYGRNLAEVFDRLFALDSSRDPLGSNFVNTLFDCVNTYAQRDGFDKTFGALSSYFPGFGTLNSSLGVRVKGTLKLLLLALWSEKAILLPYSFTFGGSALQEQASIIDALVNNLFRFFRGYKDGGAVRPSGALSLTKDAPVTLYKYAPRVILASNYSLPSNVDLVELGEFLIAERKRCLSSGHAKNTHAPVLLMAKELLTFYKDEVSFTQSDLEALSVWINSPVFQQTEPLGEFLKNGPTNKGRGGSPGIGNSGQTRKAGKLSNAAALQGHAAILDYYQELQGIRRDGLQWLMGSSPYPGREHIALGVMSVLWVEAFAAYMKYRKNVQQFDAADGIYKSFNYLCDYLFLYLPWWLELNPDSGVEVPLSPNQLKRGIFIQRTVLDSNQNQIGVDSLPMTFLDLLALRQKSADSRYGTLITVIQFLEWVEVAFEDDEKIGGKGYRSPIKRIDLPRVKRRLKTNKVPFSKKVYPHLLFYAYALEAFGQYLQQVAAENPEWFALRYRKEQKFLQTYQTPEGFDGSANLPYASAMDMYPENFGYIPFICYRGKNYPITRVPNVYQWVERTIEGSKFGVAPGPMKCWMPHMGALRMLIGAIETGLRLQSLQWLDVRTWDSANIRSGIPQTRDFNLMHSGLGGFAFPLVVSTDKTKDESWTTQIVFRLRNCFYREQYFRESIAESDMDVAVDYEDIENSRFGKIVPLFRSTHSSMPVNDRTYANYWTALLWGFEEYYNTQVCKDGFAQFVYLRKTDFEQVQDYESLNFDDLLAIHTPHACRATYATNRTGTLETSDVAQQLGHENTVVTAHYTVSTPEIMEEKLASADREIQAGFGAAYIRADSPRSALVQGFQENRAQTIGSFQFAPPIALWRTEDLANGGQDGINFLKNSPMSQIRFRETHICPVGESCPTDVLEKIGEPKRCGLCPLAMRCVDHLPAIAAKVNQLKMKIRTDIKRAERLAAVGEPDSSIDPLYEAAEMDANELVGWQFSHDILLKMLENRPQGGATEYHVQDPEIVQKHLQAVTCDRSVSEFFLQRIADAKAYPTMADPEIQRIADRYCRYILAGKYEIGVDEDPITALAGLVKTHMEPMGLTMVDLAAKIDQFESMNSAGGALLLERKQFMLSDAQE